jgi:non-ribosomal peptide synthetase component F
VHICNEAFSECQGFIEGSLRSAQLVLQSIRAALPAATPFVHAAVAAQAARTPGAVAVVAPSETLTYAQLMLRVAALQAHLAAAGLKPGDTVGVCTINSTARTVTLLACLGMQLVYMPLDGKHPSQRLAAMLAKAATRVLLLGNPDFPLDQVRNKKRGRKKEKGKT